MKRTGLMLAIILILALFCAIVRVDHVEEEGVSLWDVHLPGVTLTYSYDAIEGPVFWLTQQGRTIQRWPEFRPVPTATPTPDGWRSI